MEKTKNKATKIIFFGIITVSVLTLGGLFFIYDATSLPNTNTPQKIEIPQKVDVLKEIVTPRLQKVKNDYRLYEKNSSFIPQADASEDVNIDASAYILTDLESGEIIASKNKDEILPVASLTKVMTAVVALDLADPNEIFAVSENAANKVPTKLGVDVSEKLTVKELIEAALLTSANDATQVIADGIDNKYGEKVFIDAMNEKAKFLGLTNSSFSNPQGFDSRKNFSTVSDLAVLTHYAMTNYPLIEEIAKKDEVHLPENDNHGIFDLLNWNGLIGVYPETIGLKIGNTRRAGKTTIVISNRDGKKLTAIVLGAQSIVDRDLWAASLLDYGYEQTLGLPPIEITEDQLREKYKTWYD